MGMLHRADLLDLLRAGAEGTDVRMATTVTALDQHDGGVRVDRDAVLQTGGENAPRIVIDAEVGVGQVEVLDAAA
jgi:flavin-dependent dehydrogenase